MLVDQSDVAGLMGMNILFSILGLIIGLFIASAGGSYLLGAFAGAIIGFALAKITQQERRIKELESSAQKLRYKETPKREPVPPTETPEERPSWATPEANKAWADLEPAETISDAGPEHLEAEEPEMEAFSKPLKTPRDWPGTSPEPLLPSLLERGLEKAKLWITSGNVPVSFEWL